MKKFGKVVAMALLGCAMVFGAISCKQDTDVDAEIGVDQLSSTTYKLYNVSASVTVKTGTAAATAAKTYTGIAQARMTRNAGYDSKLISFGTLYYNYGQADADDQMISLRDSNSVKVDYDKCLAYEIYGNSYIDTNHSAKAITKDTAFDFDKADATTVTITKTETLAGNVSRITTAVITLTPAN